MVLFKDKTDVQATQLVCLLSGILLDRRDFVPSQLNTIGEPRLVSWCKMLIVCIIIVVFACRASCWCLISPIRSHLIMSRNG